MITSNARKTKKPGDTQVKGKSGSTDSLQAVCRHAKINFTQPSKINAKKDRMSTCAD